jgi:hypothetical protein
MEPGALTSCHHASSSEMPPSGQGIPDDLYHQTSEEHVMQDAGDFQFDQAFDEATRMDDGLLDGAGYSGADDALYDQNFSQASSVTMGRSQQVAYLSQPSSVTLGHSQHVDDFSQAFMPVARCSYAPLPVQTLVYLPLDAQQVSFPYTWSNVGICTLRSLH